MGPASAEEDTSYVEMRADNPNATLNRLTEVFEATGPGGTAYGQSSKTVCVLPCKQALPRNAKYFVGGDGIVGSSYFILPPGNVMLDVKSGPKGAFIGGVMISALGVCGIVTGGILSLAGATSESSKGMLVPGLVTLGAGVTALIVGIIVANRNTTKVTTAEGVTLARDERGRPRLALGMSGLVF